MAMPMDVRESPGAAPRRILAEPLRVLIMLPVVALLLFGPAGAADWWMGWATLAAYIGGILLMMLVVSLRSPDLARERASVRQDVRGWDHLLTALAKLLLILGVLPVAGFSYRWQWLPAVPAVVQIAALVVQVPTCALSAWAMLSNPYFAPSVSIQADRGHRVATGGPYRFVRHPGYLAWIVQFLSLPLALGSAWALIPGGLAAVAYVIRTALEDRTLQAELPGYAEYAQRTRYRLLPGVW